MESERGGGAEKKKKKKKTFSNSCTWSVYIEIITDAAWKRSNLLRTLLFKVNRQALEKMYAAYARLHPTPPPPPCKNTVTLHETLVQTSAKSN